MNEEKELQEQITDTVDNGVIEEVHISPIGEFTASDVEGRPVPETIDRDSLEKLAAGLNESGQEILCDVDHGAARKGTERDTKAAGWFSRFFVDPVKGLFARLKLTRHGKDLLQNREYRFISPTFTLGEDGRPLELHSASLTNTPAFAGSIEPVLNQDPDVQEPAKQEPTEKGIEDMTKEELVDLIKEVVTGLEKAEEKADDAAEEKAEVVEEKTEVVEEKTEEKTEEAANACSEEEKKAQNEEAKEEEKKEEKTEEVIKIESLNQAPRALSEVQAEDWKNLHGEKFWKWLREHPEAM